MSLQELFWLLVSDNCWFYYSIDTEARGTVIESLYFCKFEIKIYV